MKKMRLSFAVTALFYAIFAFLAINVLWCRIEFLCCQIKPVAGDGFVADFQELKPEAIPAVIGIALIALAAALVIARIVVCKKRFYFISLALVAASFAVLIITDLSFESRIFLRLFGFNFGFEQVAIYKYVKYVFMAITAIPEAVQFLIFLKNKK